MGGQRAPRGNAVIAPRLSVEQEGFSGMSHLLEAAIARRFQDGQVEFAVKTGGARGAHQNRIIAAVQAHRTRNPWFLDAPGRASLAGIAGNLLSTAAGVRKAAEDVISKIMLDSIARNVASQRNADGSAFAPLTANYAAWKRRKFGARGILQATGDLLGGLIVAVTRTTP